MPCTF